eukprot:jgi/Orpsp1_1/1192770/evm.model.d7180000095748.1
MRFNHVKGLLTSALFCAFYANAQEYQNECNKLNEDKQITSECKEDHYGFITEMDLIINAEVDEGVFADLTSLEKLSIMDKQANLVDYNYEEIASLPNLQELHLNCNRCIDDINIFKNLKNLSYLDLSYYDGENLKRLTSLHIQGKRDKHTYYFDLLENNLEGFTNLKKLSLSHIGLSEKDINNIAAMKKLEELKFEICTLNNHSFESFNNLSNLKTIEFDDCKRVIGKTLTNSKLEKCVYDVDSEYSDLCIAKDMKCLSKETKSALKSCDGSSSGSNSNDKISTNGKCGVNYGKCPSNECCSQWGYCGKTSDYCGKGCQSEFGKCENSGSSYPISTDDRCGNEFGTRCPSGECCSKHGWCGKSDAHCGSGCQSEFGKCF